MLKCKNCFWDDSCGYQYAHKENDCGCKITEKEIYGKRKREKIIKKITINIERGVHV